MKRPDPATSGSGRFVLVEVGMRSREEDIEVYRKLRRVERGGYDRWVLLIKELRVTHGVSLLEAQRIALRNRHRRRWVEQAINTNRLCRKHALSHIRHNGSAALIEREGVSFRFHIPYKGGQDV